MIVHICDCCDTKVDRVIQIGYNKYLDNGEVEHVVVDTCPDCLKYINKVLEFTVNQLKKRAENGSQSEESKEVN